MFVGVIACNRYMPGALVMFMFTGWLVYAVVLLICWPNTLVTTMLVGSLVLDDMLIVKDPVLGFGNIRNPLTADTVLRAVGAVM